MEAASRLKKLRKDPFAATSLRDLSSEFKSPEKRVEQYRQINTTPSTTSKRKYLVPKIFVHNSVEAQIKAQLDDINGSTLFSDSPTPQRSRTFAEATMSTRRGRRGTKNEYDPPSTGPKALGQVGIFKVATNKKSGKWIPLEYSTPESASASASTSDVEVDDSVSPRLSRRSSLNPTANEFELPLPNQPYEPAHLILSSSPYPSDSYNGEDGKGKGADRGEEQHFQIGATSAGRATSVAAGYYPEHLFGVDILAREDEEYGTNFYQGDATYLKHTPGYPEIEGRVENYHQESQRSEHDDLRSWALTTVVDTDPEFTPKFTQFSVPASISPGFGSVPDVSPQRFFPSVPLSTKPSKTETDQAMAHFSNSTTSKHILKPGEDAFDSLEWDPNLPTATSPDSSPEPVPIKPQPVAYTTVGSLVNPKNVPQFSAPNRIQREGANRRPLISLLSTSRQYDNVLQPRGPPPPLSMANSMHYAQQIARSPVHLTVPSTNSARPPRSTSTKNIPSRLEEAMLMRQLLGKEPQELSGNAREATGSPNASKKYSSSATIPSRQLFSIKELIEEEQHIRSSSVPGPVQGLEKMQTLQRLAKFANPMQELARNRLAEFSLLKSQNTGKTIANPTGISAQEMLLSSQIGMSSKTSAAANGDGELDRSFRFPPPGLSGARTPQVNAFNTSSSTNFPQTTSATVRPGYPEPLTAGPPGQRQYNQSVSQPPTNYQELWSTEYGSRPYNAYDSGAISSLWSNQYAGQVTTQPEFFHPHSGHVKSKLVDTIDPNALSKYYSAGYPTDMTSYYHPVSEENARLMVEGPSNLLPKEVRDARRDEATTTWYFNGQRRYNLMTPDDYMKELEVAKDYYEEKQTNPFGAIGPPKKKILPPVESKPLSEEEIKKKPITELVPPALESSWGALAGYSANNVPGSNSDLSRLMNPPDWQIDPENEGNKSYFGEDWGKPPKGSTPISWND